MTVYHFYIFDRNGQCLVERTWHQKAQSAKAVMNRCKLVFGLLYSMKGFCNRISPKPLDDLEQEPLYSFTTSEYKLHYYETPSGLRFVMSTDPKSGAPSTDLLKKIYGFYVDTVAKNPLYEPGTIPNAQVLANFLKKLDGTIETLPYFP